MTEVDILGLDLGAGAIKIVGEQGASCTLSHLALGGQQRLAAQAGLNRRRAPNLIEGDFGAFYVGAGAHHFGRPLEALDHERFGGKPDMRALMYGAFTDYQRVADPPAHGKALSLWVGLPLEPLSGERGSAAKNAVAAWIKGDHAWRVTDDSGRVDQYHISVIDAHVVSQPAAAFFDAILDDAGAPRERVGVTGEVGVLSVGFNTLELFVIDGKTPVDALSRSSTRGVRRLLSLIDPQELYSLGELDLRLRAGEIDLRRDLPIWAREIEREVERVWGRAWRRFERILVVGGGAILLREALNTLFEGRASVPDDPVMAIARGLRKIGMARQRGRRVGDAQTAR
ncbi:MAG: ParM/StbA family protein [Aggregatilineales bacterium]